MLFQLMQIKKVLKKKASNTQCRRQHEMIQYLIFEFQKKEIEKRYPKNLQRELPGELYLPLLGSCRLGLRLTLLLRDLDLPRAKSLDLDLDLDLDPEIERDRAGERETDRPRFAPLLLEGETDTDLDLDLTGLLLSLPLRSARES
eukprot:TRINITY_DN875_c0_g1_i3.p3 TRINITY_DN875_c0_g1~~TRINITY_DN875_c0_g1_i3.p3  ORF type:complete len:145 (+),score=1.36 TRINITY_DN875_c0_g1_i3:558-992(+)